MGRGSSRSRSRSPARDRRRKATTTKRGREAAPPEGGPAKKVATATTAKAVVKEKVDYAKLSESLNIKSSGDGEISMTVEDTNALRVRLGLKALNSETSATAQAEHLQAERNYALAQAASQETRRLGKIEAELARAKLVREERNREAKARMPGNTLGDNNEDEEASDWVKRSRAVKVPLAEQKLEAERRALLLFEQDAAYGADDLSGLNVAAHSAAGLKAGEHLILTMEDEQILHYDEDKHGKLVGLTKDDGNPQLGNVDRAEAQKLADQRERQRKELILAGGAGYDATDEAEFEVGAHVGPRSSSDEKQRVLGKYDAQAGLGGVALQLGKGGAVRVDEQKHLSTAARAKLSDTMDNSNLLRPFAGDGDSESLKMNQWSSTSAATGDFQPQRDYMTPAEMEAKKNKKFKKVKSRPKNVRNNNNGVLDGLMNNETTSGDRGKRGSARAAADTHDLAAGGKRANYHAAENKQTAKTRKGLGLDEQEEEDAVMEDYVKPTAATSTKETFAEKKEERPKFTPGLGEDEDDAELQASMTRIRQTNLKFSNGYAGGEDAAAKRVVSSMVKNEPVNDDEMATSSSGIVISSTTEFTARLHARLEERAAENAEEAEKRENDAAVKLEAPKAEKKDSDDDESMESGEEGDEEIDEEKLASSESGGLVDFLHAQPLAQGGMASTMALLRRTGDIQTKHVEETVGRARDQRNFHDGTSFDDVHPDLSPADIAAGVRPIKLEYRDNDGRLLTRREAFRQLCHKFHGKAPGKKKMEKIAAREAEKQRSIANAEGVGSLNILQHAQARTGQAFIPINNSMGSTVITADVQAAMKDKQKRLKSQKKAEKRAKKQQASGTEIDA